MKIEQGSLESLRDSLIESHKVIYCLRDLADVLQYGFSEINDDNIQYTTSSLWIIEKLLNGLEERLSENIKTLDTIMPQEV